MSGEFDHIRGEIVTAHRHVCLAIRALRQVSARNYIGSEHNEALFEEAREEMSRAASTVSGLQGLELRVAATQGIAKYLKGHRGAEKLRAGEEISRLHGLREQLEQVAKQRGVALELWLPKPSLFDAEMDARISGHPLMVIAIILLNLLFAIHWLSKQ